jgi:3-oxoacyl-[acyl-carrier-protein] synthase II
VASVFEEAERDPITTLRGFDSEELKDDQIVGDASETKMLKLALGEENARNTPVSSTKGATGHCLGAAGAVEAMFCVLAVDRGMLPPTINYDEPDPACDLDYIPNEARKADVRTAVSNSFGFGGHNATIVVRRFED